MLTVLLPLTACASPADVTANHDRAVRGYQDSIREAQGNIANENARFAGDLATAREWNEHVWGIPAAGWVAILIVAAVVLAVVLGTWLYFHAEARAVRRRREHELALERERTERQRIQAADELVRRGNCQVCGAAPVPENVIKEVRGE